MEERGINNFFNRDVGRNNLQGKSIGNRVVELLDGVVDFANEKADTFAAAEAQDVIDYKEGRLKNNTTCFAKNEIGRAWSQNLGIVAAKARDGAEFLSDLADEAFFEPRDSEEPRL